MKIRTIDLADGAASENAMLTPKQLQAARAIVGWTREDLSTKSGTGVATIQQFEWGGSNPKMQTVLAWRRALQQAGVIFIEDDGVNGPGVRLRDSESRQRGKR
jgi:transcriptional regulator with XRE-family HTH domain